MVDVGLDLGEVVDFLLVLVLYGEVLELVLGLLLVVVGVVLAFLGLGLEVFVALEGWGCGLAHFCQLAICCPWFFLLWFVLSIG